MNFKQLITAVSGLFVAAAGVAASADAWYLDVSMLGLNPGNKFIGRVVARNESQVPVHVQASVRRIDLRDGKRQLTDDASGTIGVFPQEFVLRPGESFPVRLIANPARIAGDAQSYYVRLQDVSKLIAQKEGDTATAAGFLLAFDTLVAVNKDKAGPVHADQFAVRQAAGGGLDLVNNSGRHVYLSGGAACPDSGVAYNDCKPLARFPRQSLLPDEVLAIPASDASFIALLIAPDLDVRRPPAVVYVKVVR